VKKVVVVCERISVIVVTGAEYSFPRSKLIKNKIT
jgi:hypothetical protein